MKITTKIKKIIGLALISCLPLSLNANVLKVDLSKIETVNISGIGLLHVTDLKSPESIRFGFVKDNTFTFNNDTRVYDIESKNGQIFTETEYLQHISPGIDTGGG